MYYLGLIYFIGSSKFIILMKRKILVIFEPNYHRIIVTLKHNNVIEK